MRSFRDLGDQRRWLHQRNVAWPTFYVFQPPLNSNVFRKIKSTFRSDVRVGIKSDVGDRESIADEPLVSLEVAVHYFERDITAQTPCTQIVGSRRSLLQQMEIVPCHADIGQMAVLLKKHPLQDPCPKQPIGRKVFRSAGKV